MTGKTLTVASMRRWPTWTAIACVVCVVTIALSAANDKWWSDYAGGADSSRFFSSKQINKSNVASLSVAWSYPYGETGSNPLIVRGTVYGRGRNGALVALDAKTGKEIWIHDGMNGMTARGMNYWESKDGKDRRLIFAMNDYLQEIDAATGKSILTFGTEGVVDMREGLGRESVARIQSGTPGRIFENLILLGSATGEGYMSPPGDLRAYNVLTGALVWQFHTIPHPGEFGYETWPPAAWKYIGGVNTWGEISLDEKRGIAYFPTGSPTYDYYGADRPGANLFSDCLLALDARTGKRLWHFQNVHHDLWDYDNNSAPQLLTIERNGKKQDVVAMAGKTGFLYVFDRVTGQPVWPIEERPVPKSTMEGEQAWPTQPFPTNPPPFSRQTFTEADINPHAAVSAKDREAFKERLSKARNDGMFTPISFIDTVQVPGNNGGSVWGSTAADPATGTMYVVSLDNPSVLRLLEPGEGRGGAGGQGLTVYMRDCQACHGPTRAGTENGPSLLSVPDRLDIEAIRATLSTGKGRMPAFPQLTSTEVDALATLLLTPSPAGRGSAFRTDLPPGPVVASGGPKTRAPFGRGGRGPIPYPEGVEQTPQYVINAYGTIGLMIKPPFTKLTRYDLNTGTIKWQVGLGDDARLVAEGITGTGVPQNRTSVLPTAGGLIFGLGGDGRVRAFDADTGSVLWTGAVRGAFRGSPSMYEIDGRQYLLVAASGDAGLAAGPIKPDLPTGLIAFALPGKGSN
jgi:quinoprotein glucose dehydrogenase